MAFIDENQKIKGQEAQSPGGQSLGGGSGGLVESAPMSGGGSQSGTTGVGTGGTGGWTNIQSYLEANKGQGKTGELFSNQVGGAFDKNKQEIDTSAKETESKAKAEVDSKSVGQSDAARLIENASKQYQYSGPQSADFQQNTQKLRDYFGANYQGPKSFEAGLSTDAQKYGSAIGNDKSYWNVMGDIYNKNATNPLTQGQNVLQQQFDINDPRVTQARQNAISQYSGLQDFQKNRVGQANDYLKAQESNFTKNQQDLRNILSGQAGQAKQNYEYELANTKKDKLSGAQGELDNADAIVRLAHGQLTPDQMARAQQLADPNALNRDFNQIKSNMDPWEASKILWQNDFMGAGNDRNLKAAWAEANAQQKRQNLDQIKSQGLGNVSDDRKREYNTIMSILNPGSYLGENDYF